MWWGSGQAFVNILIMAKSGLTAADWLSKSFDLCGQVSYIALS
jgi:hypothetical protein